VQRAAKEGIGQVIDNKARAGGIKCIVKNLEVKPSPGIFQKKYFNLSVRLFRGGELFPFWHGFQNA
jgi:hypothetical protein